MALSGSVFEIWHVTDRQTDRHPHRFMIWPHIVGHIITVVNSCRMSMVCSGRRSSQRGCQWYAEPGQSWGCFQTVSTACWTCATEGKLLFVAMPSIKGTVVTDPTALLLRDYHTVLQQQRIIGMLFFITLAESYLVIAPSIVILTIKWHT